MASDEHRVVGERAFDHVPRTPRGHFVLGLHAAIYRLLDHVHRLSDAGGVALPEIFRRFPFLARYFDEIAAYVPEGLNWREARAFWERGLTSWEASCAEHLPLRALRDGLGLDRASWLALLAIGLVEEDSRFGTLFSELQAPLRSRRPTLELVGQLASSQDAPSSTGDPWSVCKPLIDHRLVVPTQPDAPRSEWVLRVPPSIWDAVRGSTEERLEPGLELLDLASFDPLADLVCDDELRARLERLPELVRSGRVTTLVLRGDPGAPWEAVFGAVARELGRNLIRCAPGVTATADDRQQRLGPLCTLTASLPLLRLELAPGETGSIPQLDGFVGLTGVALGLEGGLEGEGAQRAVTVELRPPRAAERRQHWRASLGEGGLEDEDAVVDAFHLSGGFIGRAARLAEAEAGLQGRERVCSTDVRAACRAMNRQLLDTLAERLEVRGGWGELVATETTKGKLEELTARCRQREHVLDHLGPAFRGGKRGVRALFSGSSGTGKTLSARLLAAELGMDLYRVDLAAVVNKYIGETEKNLHQVLSRAEALDVVLLLDEGDALLAQRTEVKSANDRYANLETNYLLQRLENYDAICVVTTNAGESIDQGFQRRMDVVVPFFPPLANDRMRILELHLPADHLVTGAYLQLVARRCTLTGGQLRNTAMQSSLFALEEGVPVGAEHLHRALECEYSKAGGTFPLKDDALSARALDGGVDSFLAALADG